MVRRGEGIQVLVPCGWCGVGRVRRVVWERRKGRNGLALRDFLATPVSFLPRPLSPRRPHHRYPQPTLSSSWTAPPLPTPYRAPRPPLPPFLPRSQPAQRAVSPPTPPTSDTPRPSPTSSATAPRKNRSSCVQTASFESLISFVPSLLLSQFLH